MVGIVPLETLALAAFSERCLIMRGNLLHFPVCRLVMYIERDSRKIAAGKEQQSGNEYLSKCLVLLIHHLVQEPPRVLGKPVSSSAPGCLPLCSLALRHHLSFAWASLFLPVTAVTLSSVCSLKI